MNVKAKARLPVSCRKGVFWDVREGIVVYEFESWARANGRRGAGRYKLCPCRVDDPTYVFRQAAAFFRIISKLHSIGSFARGAVGSSQLVGTRFAWFIISVP